MFEDVFKSIPGNLRCKSYQICVILWSFPFLRNVDVIVIDNIGILVIIVFFNQVNDYFLARLIIWQSTQSSGILFTPRYSSRAVLIGQWKSGITIICKSFSRRLGFKMTTFRRISFPTNRNVRAYFKLWISRACVRATPHLKFVEILLMHCLLWIFPLNRLVVNFPLLLFLQWTDVYIWPE